MPKKRTRVGDTVRRTFSKMSKLGDRDAINYMDDNNDDKGDAEDEDGNEVIEGDAVTTAVHNMVNPQTARKGTTSAREALKTATREAVTATREAFSRLSVLSAMARSEPVVQDRLKICILGAANAGKTALIKYGHTPLASSLGLLLTVFARSRLTHNTFVEVRKPCFPLTLGVDMGEGRRLKFMK